MKFTPLFYCLVLTGVDIFLLWTSELSTTTQLMTLSGVGAVASLGLLVPINSFMVKILVSSAIFAVCATLSPLTLFSGLLFSSITIHASALWYELEKIAGQDYWKTQYKIIHRMRHHWLGGLFLYAGLFLCYNIINMTNVYTNSEWLALLLLTAFVTFLYMEANRLHNPKAFWVEVGGALSASTHYWFLIIFCGGLLFAFSWHFSSRTVDQLLELRNMIGDEAQNEEGDLPVRSSKTRSGFQPGDMRLSSKVDITLSNDPVMLVSLKNPVDLRRFRRLPLYIAAQDLVTYSNNIWRSIPNDLTWYKDLDDNKIDGKILLRARKLGNIRHTIYLLQKNRTSLFSLSGLHTVELPEFFKSDQGVFGIRDNGDGQLKKYTVESSYANYEELKRRELKVGKPKNSAYTDLVDSRLTKKIKSLTWLIVKPGDSNVTKINKIKAYLHSKCDYSLKVDNPENKMPLENFIFSERKGHCVLFASAFTLMLRAEGIPAKVVQGYAGGELDKDRRLFLLRSSNAHAWTEIYFEKYGWVVCDPTPEDTGNIQRNVTSIANFSEDSFFEVSQESLVERGENDESELFSKRHLLILLVIILLCSFAWQYIRVIPALSFLSRKAKKHNLKRPLFIQAFEQYCRQNEIVFNSSHTVGEILVMLKAKRTIDQEIINMVNYYYEVSFQGCERSENKEKEWLKLLTN
jgi:hypothetical protein